MFQGQKELSTYKQTEGNGTEINSRGFKPNFDLLLGKYRY